MDLRLTGVPEHARTNEAYVCSRATLLASPRGKLGRQQAVELRNLFRAFGAKEIDRPTGIELGVRLGVDVGDVVEVLASTKCDTHAKLWR